MPVASGGTGATTAVNARANLGIGCTLLKNTPLTTGSTTVDVTGYSALSLVGKGGANAPSQALYVPIILLSSTEFPLTFGYEYNGQYVVIYLSISDSTVTIRYGTSNSNGSLQYVYGVT